MIVFVEETVLYWINHASSHCKSQMIRRKRCWFCRCYTVALLEDRKYATLAPFGGFAFIAAWASLLFWGVLDFLGIRIKQHYMIVQPWISYVVNWCRIISLADSLWCELNSGQYFCHLMACTWQDLVIHTVSWILIVSLSVLCPYSYTIK